MGEKWILVFLAVIMAVTLSACGNSTSSENSGTETLAESPVKELAEESRDTDVEKPSQSTIETETEFPLVYMTTDISPKGLQVVYEALGASPSGSIAVKLSTGENGSNYLRPELILHSMALGTTALVVRILSCFLCGIAAGLLVHFVYGEKAFFVLIISTNRNQGTQIPAWYCVI